MSVYFVARLYLLLSWFLVACYATLHPAMSVRRLVGRLVPFLLFQHFWASWAYYSCPDALVTFSSTAPAHPHATKVAVYPALLFFKMSRWLDWWERENEIYWKHQRTIWMGTPSLHPAYSNSNIWADHVKISDFSMQAHACSCLLIHSCGLFRAQYQTYKVSWHQLSMRESRQKRNVG